MQRNRTVARLLYAEETDMGGLPLRQVLPTGQVAQYGPFLLLAGKPLEEPLACMVPS